MFSLSLLALVFILVGTGEATADNETSELPEGIRLFLPLNQDPATGIGMTWFTNASVEDTWVRYGIDNVSEGAVEGYSLVPDQDNWTGRLHFANLSGLRSQTQYSYQVGDGGLNWSQTYQFETQQTAYPEGEFGSNGPRLALAGRMGVSESSERVAWDLANWSNRYDALLIPGGAAMAPGSELSQWADWARHISNFSRENLLLPGWGGPDSSGEPEVQRLARLWLPPLVHTTYYEVRFGGVQLLVLDAQGPLVQGSAQRLWLEERLATGWEDPLVLSRVISLYEPLYGNGITGGNLTLRSQLDELIASYPGTVLVSSAEGHYSRSLNLSRGQPTGELFNGSLHLEVGMGGSALGKMSWPWTNTTTFAHNESYGHVGLHWHGRNSLGVNVYRSSYHHPPEGWSRLEHKVLDSLIANEPKGELANYSVQGEPLLLEGSAGNSGLRWRWLSTIEGIVLEQQNGLVSLSNGSHDLALQVRWENSSWSWPVWFEHEVNGRPQTRLESYPSFLHQFQTGSFSGTAFDDNEVIGHEWRSNRDGLISILPSFSYNGLSNGSHNLSFWALDNHGEWSSPITGQVFINGLPVVEAVRSEKSAIRRGESLRVEFGGFDGDDPNELLTAQLQYQRPGGGWSDEVLADLTFNDTEGVWRSQFSPAGQDETGQYSFLARLIDTQGGASNWREGATITVRNNRPEVIGVGLGGLPPHQVERGGFLELWSRGRDTEQTSAFLTPIFQYRGPENGSDWSEAGFGAALYNLSTDQWRVSLIPPDLLERGSYDLRAAFTDGDGGVSDWLTFAEAFNVTNRRPVIQDLKGDTSTLFTNETLMLTLEVNDENLMGLTVELEFRELVSGAWQTEWNYSALFQNDHWRIAVQPGHSANNTNHSARVLVLDDFGLTSGWFDMDDLFTIKNLAPRILGHKVSNVTPLRNQPFSLTLDLADYEFEAPGSDNFLSPRLKLKGPWGSEYWGDNLTVGQTGVVMEFKQGFVLGNNSVTGPYELWAQLTDEDGAISLPYQPVGPVIQLGNNLPRVRDVVVEENEVYRGGELVIGVIGDDADQLSSSLSCNISYRRSGSATWQMGWLSNTSWNDSLARFDISFRPSIQALTGQYSFRFSLEDPEGGLSDTLVLENLTMVKNNEPILEELTLLEPLVVRGGKFRLTFLTQDGETEPLLLVPRLGHLVNGTFQPLNWPAQVVDIEISRGPGDTGLLTLEVDVPLGVSAGQWELFGQVLDQEGQPSAQWGPLTLMVENNAPTIKGAGFVSDGIRTRSLHLWVVAEDMDNPLEDLFISELNLSGMLEGQLYFDQSETESPEPGTLFLELVVAEDWELGDFNLTIGVSDGDVFQPQLRHFKLADQLKVLNHPPRVETILLEQVDYKVNLSAFANDPDGQVRHFEWYLDGEPRAWEGPDLVLSAGKLGGGNHTFGLVVVDGDGSRSPLFNATLAIIAPPKSSDSALPWFTARLIGVFLFLGLITIIIGGTMARSYHAAQNELFKLPPFLVDEIFMVSWDGRPISHVSASQSKEEATRVDPALVQEVMQAAMLLSGRDTPVPEDHQRLKAIPRPGCLGHIGTLDLEQGGRLVVIAGQFHFLGLICWGRPQQSLLQASEMVLREFEAGLPLLDGKPLKLEPAQREQATSQLWALLSLTGTMDREQLKQRLGVRKVQAEGRIVARNGRFLWQVLVINPLRSEIREGELRLDWPLDLAEGPASQKVQLPAMARGSQESFTIPLEPQVEGEGLCKGKLDFKVHGSWDRISLTTRPLIIKRMELQEVADAHRARKLLELEGLADRRRLEYPLPELIKGELVAGKARRTLSQLGLMELVELERDTQTRAAMQKRGSVWGGQDGQGELLVAALGLEEDLLSIQLVAERPATLAAMVGAFRAQFKTELGDIYDLLQVEVAG